MNNLLKVVKSILHLVIILLFLPVQINPQEIPLAKFNGINISPQEFKYRYELMPRLSNDYVNNDTLKKEFLYTLISEKLWAKEAALKGFDTLDIFKYSILPIQKLYVRDALFKNEIESKILITREELSGALNKNKKLLQVNIISSKDSADVYDIYNQISAGASFDSLLKLREEFSHQDSITSITFGSLDNEEIEDSLFNMITGAFTSPVKTNSGWFIFNIKNIVKNPDELKQSDIKNILKERKARFFGMQYLSELLKSKQVKINEELFWELTDKIESRLKDKSPYGEDEKYFLNEADIIKIIERYNSEELKKDFILFEKDPVSLKEFIYYLNFIVFQTNDILKNEIALSLNRAAKSFIESELITREGNRKGYSELPEVKKQVKMWEENFLSRMLKNRFIDSVEVSQDEIREQYNQIYNSDEEITHVKFEEIFTTDLDIIELILEELKTGKDFSGMIETYDERSPEARYNPDEYYPVTTLGEIGETINQMEIGEIFGPVKTMDGYSIIKLIDKNESSSASQDFNQVKEQLKNSLVSEKLNKLYKDFTVQLANKNNLQINYDILKSVKVTEVNMFTYRLMGFGGKITAAPFIMSFYDWGKIWEKEKLSP